MSHDLHSFDDMFFGSLAADQGALENTRADDRAIANSIRSSLNKVQLNLLEDPCRRKTALCPRRSGKSHVAMSYAFDTCLRKVGARVVVVTLTLKHAKNVYWFDMQKFANRFGVQGAKFYQNELRIIFRNSSQLWLIGAESHAEIEKLRGGQYDLIVIDECKSYPPVILHELVNVVVMPALADRRGTVLLIGTPGNIMKGLFFETTYPGYSFEGKDKKIHLVARDFYKPEPYWTKGRKLYWSRHHWTVEDNTAMPHLWAEMLELKELNHWDDDEPMWRREALGEWVNSIGAFVYAYAGMLGDGPMNVAHWSPDFVAGNKHGLMPRDAEWRYILGIDLGYDDHLALVVGAYNTSDGVLYHVWEYHEPKLDVYDAVDRVDEAIAKFGSFDAIVADTGGLGKMIIETLNKRYGYAIKPAEKTQKFDHIELLNADIRSGRVKIMPQSDLATQMAILQYDLSRGAKEDLARNGKLKEHPGMPNDLCDAFLYLWRYSYHYYSDERPTLAPVGSAQWQRDLEQRAMEIMVRQRASDANSVLSVGWANIDPLKDYYGRN